MKKLYKKSTVHPSPPPPISDHHLSLLPAAIFTLTISLSAQDKEVLAYLLSSSTKKPTTTTAATTAADHPPLFNCSCFRCYMSYWVRWDSSPNRQLIHEIIDALEDGIMVRNKKEKNKKDRKKKLSCSSSSSGNEDTESTESDELTRSPEVSHGKMESVVECGGGEDEEEEEEGTVRKIVSFLGERIWSVWT
ncbi:hypothetical protein L6452_35236 [Arctium lappa]|uniref:Uncharacterized protein n=1 Tax=Arctium lappa TaxID=4217 RepID=A0ACB8Y5A2_ARCLA|nr:hypothetical protein L6452_35236 [Arctium lappa]